MLGEGVDRVGESRKPNIIVDDIKNMRAFQNAKAASNYYTEGAGRQNIPSRTFEDGTPMPSSLNEFNQQNIALNKNQELSGLDNVAEDNINSAALSRESGIAPSEQTLSTNTIRTYIRNKSGVFSKLLTC